jgi:hypothetical protein
MKEIFYCLMNDFEIRKMAVHSNHSAKGHEKALTQKDEKPNII